MKFFLVIVLCGGFFGSSFASELFNKPDTLKTPSLDRELKERIRELERNNAALVALIASMQGQESVHIVKRR